MGTQFIVVAKRVTAALALTVAALGGALVTGTTVAHAAVKHLTLTLVSCTYSATYGTATTCTVTVSDLAVLSPKTTPTGTVTVTTLLGRLNGGTCALAAVSSSTASCTVNVTPIDTGLMLPYASYPGDADHFASLSALPGSINAAPAPLTITAQSTSREYGAADPTFAVDYSGFVLSDNATVLLGSLSCSSTAIASSPEGDYPITCGGLTSPTSPIPTYVPHYSITWVPGTLHVDKITLTVTANDAFRIYGAANPSFSVTYSGFVGIDDETDLGGSLVCSTTADASSPVGPYDITCSGLTSTTYNVVFVDGTLSVLSAPGAKLPSGTAELVAGANLVLDVDNWEPGSTVNVEACDGAIIGTIVVGADGAGQGVFIVPDDVPAGECIVNLTGTDKAGNPAQFGLSVMVNELPTSGATHEPILATGLLAIVCGAGLWSIARRRRPAL